MRLLTALPALALLAASLVSCKADEPSAIVVGVSNELPTVNSFTTSTDKSTILTAVHIVVRAGGEDHLDVIYDLRQDFSRIPLPGTLTISKDEKSTSDSVTVEIRGLAAVADENTGTPETVIVKRTATLSFVNGKQKLLRMPLQMACANTPSCEAGETCKAGTCSSDAVNDVDSLPDFSAAKVIPDNSSCFKREDCVDDDHDTFTRDELLQVLGKQPALLAKLTTTTDDPARVFAFNRQNGKCLLPSIGLRKDNAGQISTVDHKDNPDNVNMGFFWKADPKRWIVVDRDSQEGWDYTTDSEGQTWVQLNAGACDELELKNSRIVGIINYESDKPQCASKPPTQPECTVPNEVPTGAGGTSGASGSGGTSGQGGTGGAGGAGQGGASQGGASQGGAGQGGSGQAGASLGGAGQGGVASGGFGASAASGGSMGANGGAGG